MKNPSGLRRPSRLRRPCSLSGLRSPSGLRWLSSLMALVTAVTLTGCSSDDDEPRAEVSIPVELTGFVSEYQELVAGDGADDAAGVHVTHEAAWAGDVTRAWTTPTGFEHYDGPAQVIGVCFTQNNIVEPIQGLFFRGVDSWRTTVELTEGTYYLYGYTPHTSGVECEITDLYGSNSSFSEGAVMTIKNLPAVTANDVCVVVGAKNGKESVSSTSDYTIPGLEPGNFAYEAKAITAGQNGSSGSGTGNYVFLLFDHLYAAMSIHLMVDGEYNALRTIKLKKLYLQTSDDHGVTTTLKKTDITVTLKAGAGDETIQSVVFSPSASNANASDAVEPMFTSASGRALSANYEEFASHFMPQGINSFILTSVYDVYDKNVTPEHPDGNLIRQDCTATNTIPISVFYLQTIAERGTKYILKLTINPTFLYVLSDPDLDNPTVTLTTN